MQVKAQHILMMYKYILHISGKRRRQRRAVNISIPNMRLKHQNLSPINFWIMPFSGITAEDFDAKYSNKTY